MASFATLKSKIPAQHQADFDKAVSGIAVGSANEAKLTGILTNLIALIEAVAGSINWPCLISVIPMLATFTLAALLAAFAAYEACVNPKP